MKWIWLVYVLCLFCTIAGYSFGCLVGWNKAVDTIEKQKQEKK